MTEETIDEIVRLLQDEKIVYFPDAQKFVGPFGSYTASAFLANIAASRIAIPATLEGYKKLRQP